ncbi:MAG: hypothetical protein HRT88_20375 [Lentisphaeraceae bacterium]|nr:hypothetical protein [Lentisphaeraceae bacterium]
MDANGQGNQDFLMINTESFAFANVDDYLRLTKTLIENNDDPTKYFAPLKYKDAFTPEEFSGTLKTFKIINEIKSKPVSSSLDIQYFGAAPYSFGRNRVMRFSVIPSNNVDPQPFPVDLSENYLKNELLKRMAGSEDLAFDFVIQVREKDEEGLDLEDATARWSDTPYISVGRISIPLPQTGLDTDEYKAECEKLVYNPWHALKEHKPLGGINRLRKKVYKASAKHRLTSRPTEQEPGQ